MVLFTVVCLCIRYKSTLETSISFNLNSRNIIKFINNIGISKKDAQGAQKLIHLPNNGVFYTKYIETTSFVLFCSVHNPFPYYLVHQYSLIFIFHPKELRNSSMIDRWVISANISTSWGIYMQVIRVPESDALCGKNWLKICAIFCWIYP